MSMKTEQVVQSEVRLEASNRGFRLWRNNVGVAMDNRGIPVRYGLCNESKQMNKNLKSSDLIGIRPILITQDMVGKVFGQFIAIEIKKESWKPSPSNLREQAQERFITLVQSLGGYAKIINKVEDL